MDRAEQGAGDALVNVLAYKADYVAATEELKLLEGAARAKHCSLQIPTHSGQVFRIDAGRDSDLKPATIPN